MSANAELGSTVIDLCAKAAEAWVTNRPNLAERLAAAAHELLDGCDFVDIEQVDQ